MHVGRDSPADHVARADARADNPGADGVVRTDGRADGCANARADTRADDAPADATADLGADGAADAAANFRLRKYLYRRLLWLLGHLRLYL